ncbi:putative ABC transporter periplasmic solute-binding protein [Vibrio variabilis]|uniref:ABC transporter periplasmic solute-binding protein n=1 Tax=Vibrio variabilis TaxID=990271 RepID=A0ABQ0JRD2_9VIBR|nr:putative ABC transporter periplasmic solute-binding protein [Vibrio variabilis]
MKTVKHLVATTILSATVSATAWAGELVINSDQADPAPKEAWAEIVKRFEAENPDITVKYNLYDKEAYKTTIRNWLVTSPPDVVFWYAGNRMKTFVDRGLLEDVSDIWAENNMLRTSNLQHRQ